MWHAGLGLELVEWTCFAQKEKQKRMGTLTQNITTIECEASMQGVVVVCTAGFGADPERRGCH